MNFKEELLKINTIDLENACLISKEPLSDNKITLECGHSFNYVSLYNEVIYQKRILNSLETNPLLTNQMKCPYCRRIYNYILPYQELDGVYKLYGVNSPDKLVMSMYKCRWLFKSGKKKNNTCNVVAGLYKDGCYCNKHIENIKKPETSTCFKILLVAEVIF